MKPHNNVEVFPSADALAEGAAKFITEAAINAVNKKGRFVISLSGGHTPERLFTLMSKPPYHDQIPWDKTFVFWGDERCVPADDKDNNSRMARLTLLDHVAIPAGNIYPVPVDLTPEKAAEEYENTIRKFFGSEPPVFDIILLGLGENGHTASLFPGTDVIFEHTRLVKEVYVTEQNMFRITMTAKLINAADNIVFLLEGAGKADVLNTIINGAYEPNKFPAQLIKPASGKLYWFIDNKAAAQLKD